jgi:hypothetical protein
LPFVKAAIETSLRAVKESGSRKAKRTDGAAFANPLSIAGIGLEHVYAASPMASKSYWASSGFCRLVVAVGLGTSGLDGTRPSGIAVPSRRTASRRRSSIKWT